MGGKVLNLDVFTFGDKMDIVNFMAERNISFDLETREVAFVVDGIKCIGLIDATSRESES